MALNPNISLAVRGVELQDPLAQYGKFAAIQGAQQQNQLAQMQMQEYERTRAEEEGLRNYLAGADLSKPETRAELMRQYGKTGMAYNTALSAQEKAALERQKTQLEFQKGKQDFMSQALRDTSRNPSDANITAYLEDLDANPLFSREEKASVRSTANRILAMPFEQRGAVMASQGATAEGLKPSNIQINRGGRTDVFERGAYGGALTPIGTYEDIAPPPAVQAAKAAVAAAGAPTVSVSTGKKYGEAFGSNLAEADIAKLAAAEKAPQLADSANRIIDLVQQGNVFTGPVADIKLNIARVLNVAGADNQEKIANTEALIAATGQSTLDSIKSAGLGTGQGFTDKDLKFLQGIAGGTIGLTPQTLTRLAELQHRTATRSAEAWGNRVKQIPSDVLQGTGLSTAPIKVPELRSRATNVVVTPDGQSHSFPTAEAAAKFKKAVGQ